MPDGSTLSPSNSSKCRDAVVKAVACFDASADLDEKEAKVHQVISAETMAEMTVRIAQVIREFGYECRYNESLNCLQYGLVKEYFDGWLSQPVAAQSGIYQYWEDAHQRAGISRRDDDNDVTTGTASNL